MNSKCQLPSHKRIYSLRLKKELKKLGFEPIIEADNIQKPGFKCWVYEISPAFLEAFDKLLRKEE
jgi:hypothetical protein